MADTTTAPSADLYAAYRGLDSDVVGYHRVFACGCAYDVNDAIRIDACERHADVLATHFLPLPAGHSQHAGDPSSEES